MAILDNNKHFDVKDCVALVTGNNKKGSIGCSIINTLLKSGAGKVYVTTKEVTQLEYLVESCSGKIVPIVLDFVNTSNDATLLMLQKQCSDVNLIINIIGHSSEDINEFEDQYLYQSFSLQTFKEVLNRNRRKYYGNEIPYALMVTVSSATITYCDQSTSGYYLTLMDPYDRLQDTLSIDVFSGEIDVNSYSWDSPASQSAALELIKAIKEKRKEHVVPDTLSTDAVYSTLFTISCFGSF